MPWATTPAIAEDIFFACFDGILQSRKLLFRKFCPHGLMIKGQRPKVGGNRNFTVALQKTLLVDLHDIGVCCLKKNKFSVVFLFP